MKFYLTTASVLLIMFLSSCNSGSESGNSGIDSMRIAKMMAERYPDSVCKLADNVFLKGFNVNGDIVQWKSLFSERIKEADARTEHINYLLKNGLQNSAYTVIHSLFITKKDLKTVFDSSVMGARLSFSFNEYGGRNYIGLIMVPLDAKGRNKLGTDENPIMVNRLEPCPDKCPEDTLGLDESDLNYNKYGIIDPKYKDLWLMPNQRGWVDKTGTLKYPL